MASYEDQGKAYNPFAVGHERVGRASAPIAAPRSFRIGTATVTYYPEGAYTTYEDGSSYAAQPHDSHHYHVIAHRCGYGDDVLSYAREHEVCHHIVSEWIGGHTSKVLWPLAHGREPDPFDATAEEALAMTFQRWLRSAERPIIGGVDWGGLKARAVALLDA